MAAVIECVPNFSEGRRKDVVDKIVHSIRSVPGTKVLDVESDPDHNRSVVNLHRDQGERGRERLQGR